VTVKKKSGGRSWAVRKKEKKTSLSCLQRTGGTKKKGKGWSSVRFCFCIKKKKRKRERQALDPAPLGGTGRGGGANLFHTSTEEGGKGGKRGERSHLYLHEWKKESAELPKGGKKNNGRHPQFYPILEEEERKKKKEGRPFVLG